MSVIGILLLLAMAATAGVLVVGLIERLVIPWHASMRAG